MVLSLSVIAKKMTLFEYSEDLGLMKATKTFYENHKNIIDKTLPEEEKPTTDNLLQMADLKVV